MANDGISVRTHVGRDLLQSAGLFKTDKLVVWEYVANGLQYVDPGVTPEVKVTLDARSKAIVIADNGRGMDQTDLQNFFLMHGENLDRKAGHGGRGRFGTGKSAAFGIADRLRVCSIKNGNRNTVELRRSDIEKAGEHDVRVRSIERDIPTHEPNGTIVEILDIRLRSFDPTGVIRYVERHLARWPSRPLVVVNSHICEPPDPPIASVEKIRPTGAALLILGDVELTIKTSKVPLETEMQGINIFTNGSWLETTLAGCGGQPMSQYIFGEIDIPALDDDSAPIPAYDMSRSMQLNPNNEIVEALFAFIGPEVDKIRRRLSKEEQLRRVQEEAKHLAREASKIAEIINEDFRDFANRVAKVRTKGGVGSDLGLLNRDGGSDLEVLQPGGNEPAEQLTGTSSTQDRDSEGSGDHERRSPILVPDSDGDRKGSPAGGNGQARKPRGGFQVEFKGMAAEAPRALYARSERTIYVNLDHPQIVAAKGAGSIEDPLFRRLAYEVAFSEYAIALAYEFAEQSEYVEPSEPIFDIRETINRMARHAAPLYR